MKYLKGVADTSVIECDEIVLVMGVLSRKKTNTIATKTTNTIATKMTNTIARNVTSTASINCHSKRGFYILHTVLLVIILLMIIATICYHYATQQKGMI